MIILALKELTTVHKNIKLQLTTIQYLRQTCGRVGYEYKERLPNPPGILPGSYDASH